ncbi:MAG TPA: septal ring lytic transglycosylase RlpA family lipoprotein [Micromonosporaceae bacterium]|nr:septal ring lytic transglycosylase RlpA family lipoprotein [Micromonosporaceae bacterium]HCU49662.1 septal ring lytic transglycosylase RlpA family lipoprotein [Micromonosporaceae bacterium]
MSGRRVKRAPIASASIATAILIGGTYLGLARADHNETADAAPAAPSPSSSSPSAEPTRPAEPLSRDMAAERTSSPAPEKVTSTGSCGASFYHEPQGTANGETFNPEALTAAHKTLPFNSRVRVTNPANGKSVIVRINDRGPYISGRCIDLSRAAFREIANLSQGVLKVVNYEVLAK